MTYVLGLKRRLRDACLKARDFAARAGGVSLATVTVESPAFDAVGLYESAFGSRKTFWLQPSNDLAIVAVGETKRVALSGSLRFSQARSSWQEMRDAVVIDADDAPFAAPLVLTGFAFSSSDESRDTRFSDGFLILPRLLFVRMQGRTWLNATVAVTPNIDVDTEVRALISEAEACLRMDSSCGRGIASECVQIKDGRDQKEWEAGVSSILNEIAAGRVEKVVLARTVGLESEEEFSIPEALRRLEQRYPQCTLFAFSQGNTSFLGATPERLLRFKDDVVSVDSLAGSISRGHDAGEDERLASKLLRDPKELHEHRVVTEAIEQNLAPLCSNIDVAPESKILTYANVHHLYTPISAVAMPGHDIFDFVEGLHPTPATGGYPRNAALDLIRKHETFDRGWYAGPCGWIDARGNGEFVVAIRSALVEDRKATLYAGSGIVAGSDPSREYQETAVKLKAMLWALGLE